MATAMCSLKG